MPPCRICSAIEIGRVVTPAASALCSLLLLLLGRHRARATKLGMAILLLLDPTGIDSSSIHTCTISALTTPRHRWRSLNGAISRMMFWQTLVRIVQAKPSFPITIVKVIVVVVVVVVIVMKSVVIAGRCVVGAAALEGDSTFRSTRLGEDDVCIE